MRQIRFVYLGSESPQRPRIFSTTWGEAENLHDVVASSSHHCFWVISDPRWVHSITDTIQSARHQRPGASWGSLISTTASSPKCHSMGPLLRTRFQEVVLGSEVTLAESDDLLEILSAPEEERRSLFVGVRWDETQQGLVLVRGDLSYWFAPADMFAPAADGTTPDFRQARVTDSGNTVALGAYEASADAILYEVDPHYRRELNRKRRAEEQGFGPALRRLRLQRGLKQEDFAPLDRKTISRLEHQQTRPQVETLRVLGERLGVEPKEIETY